MRKLLIPITVLILAVTAMMCSKIGYEKPEEEISTAKVPAAKNCYTVCDVNQSPDVQLVTNAQEVRPLLPDGQIDSFSYFYTNYHVRTNPIRLVQNFVTPASYAVKYGWKEGDTVNRVQLQCLVENIAALIGCINDWSFRESQGYLVGQNIFFDGLFQFDTYEKGNGNNWKLLTSDYKKEFFPDAIPNVKNLFSVFCYDYERMIQAQTGDFYYNYFRFPNHDGVYRLVIKFNPLIKGCRAVKETDYTNNEVTIELQIMNGVVTILNSTNT